MDFTETAEYRLVCPSILVGLEGTKYKKKVSKECQLGDQHVFQQNVDRMSHMRTPLLLHKKKKKKNFYKDETCQSHRVSSFATPSCIHKYYKEYHCTTKDCWISHLQRQQNYPYLSPHYISANTHNTINYERVKYNIFNVQRLVENSPRFEPTFHLEDIDLGEKKMLGTDALILDLAKANECLSKDSSSSTKMSPIFEKNKNGLYFTTQRSMEGRVRNSNNLCRDIITEPPNMSRLVLRNNNSNCSERSVSDAITVKFDESSALICKSSYNGKSYYSSSSSNDYVPNWDTFHLQKKFMQHEEPQGVLNVLDCCTSETETQQHAHNRLSPLFKDFKLKNNSFEENTNSQTGLRSTLAENLRLLYLDNLYDGYSDIPQISNDPTDFSNLGLTSKEFAELQQERRCRWNATHQNDDTSTLFSADSDLSHETIFRSSTLPSLDIKINEDQLLPNKISEQEKQPFKNTTIENLHHFICRANTITTTTVANNKNFIKDLTSSSSSLSLHENKVKNKLFNITILLPTPYQTNILSQRIEYPIFSEYKHGQDLMRDVLLTYYDRIYNNNQSLFFSNKDDRHLNSILQSIQHFSLQPTHLNPKQKQFKATLFSFPIRHDTVLSDYFSLRNGNSLLSKQLSEIIFKLCFDDDCFVESLFSKKKTGTAFGSLLNDTDNDVLSETPSYLYEQEESNTIKHRHHFDTLASTSSDNEVLFPFKENSFTPNGTSKKNNNYDNTSNDSHEFRRDPSEFTKTGLSFKKKKKTCHKDEEKEQFFEDHDKKDCQLSKYCFDTGQFVKNTNFKVLKEDSRGLRLIIPMEKKRHRLKVPYVALLENATVNRKKKIWRYRGGIDMLKRNFPHSSIPVTGLYRQDTTINNNLISKNTPAASLNKTGLRLFMRMPLHFGNKLLQNSFSMSRNSNRPASLSRTAIKDTSLSHFKKGHRQSNSHYNCVSSLSSLQSESKMQPPTKIFIIMSPKAATDLTYMIDIESKNVGAIQTKLIELCKHRMDMARVDVPQASRVFGLLSSLIKHPSCLELLGDDKPALGSLYFESFFTGTRIATNALIHSLCETDSCMVLLKKVYQQPIRRCEKFGRSRRSYSSNSRPTTASLNDFNESIFSTSTTQIFSYRCHILVVKLGDIKIPHSYRQWIRCHLVVDSQRMYHTLESFSPLNDDARDNFPTFNNPKWIPMIDDQKLHEPILAHHEALPVGYTGSRLYRIRLFNPQQDIIENDLREHNKKQLLFHNDSFIDNENVKFSTNQRRASFETVSRFKPNSSQESSPIASRSLRHRFCSVEANNSLSATMIPSSPTCIVSSSEEEEENDKNTGENRKCIEFPFRQYIISNNLSFKYLPFLVVPPEVPGIHITKIDVSSIDSLSVEVTFIVSSYELQSIWKQCSRRTTPLSDNNNNNNLNSTLKSEECLMLNDLLPDEHCSTNYLQTFPHTSTSMPTLSNIEQNSKKNTKEMESTLLTLDNNTSSNQYISPESSISLKDFKFTTIRYRTESPFACAELASKLTILAKTIRTTATPKF